MCQSAELEQVSLSVRQDAASLTIGRLDRPVILVLMHPPWPIDDLEWHKDVAVQLMIRSGKRIMGRWHHKRITVARLHVHTLERLSNLTGSGAICIQVKLASSKSVVS